VGVFDLEQDVGWRVRDSHEAIDDALAHERTPVVVGGTGLYLRGGVVGPRALPRRRRASARRVGVVLRRWRRARARQAQALDRRQPRACTQRPAPRCARTGLAEGAVARR
jgi:tRNA A37 N6-isopentenylltransferase MiaA